MYIRYVTLSRISIDVNYAIILFINTSKSSQAWSESIEQTFITIYFINITNSFFDDYKNTFSPETIYFISLFTESHV